MGRVVRWLAAVLLVASAIAIVYIVEPTTCSGDMCSDNVLAEFFIVLAGVIARFSF